MQRPYTQSPDVTEPSPLAVGSESQMALQIGKNVACLFY
jgi:hypothetical protein